MKKLVILFFLLIFSTTTFAQQIDENGFNGIKWGTDISQLKDMAFIESSSTTSYYTRQEKSMVFENVNIRKIVYVFENNKFDGVFLYCDTKHKSYLISRLIKRYGGPDATKEGFEYIKLLENTCMLVGVIHNAPEKSALLLSAIKK